METHQFIASQHSPSFASQASLSSFLKTFSIKRVSGQTVNFQSVFAVKEGKHTTPEQAHSLSLSNSPSHFLFSFPVRQQTQKPSFLLGQRPLGYTFSVLVLWMLVCE